MIVAAEQPGGLAGLAVDLMDHLGGPGAALLVGLDNIFPPVPSELVLPLAGFAASQGTMSLFMALFWTTLGSVVGALLTYWIGALLGRDRVRALIIRVPLMKESDFVRTEHWFLRHGTKAVFFGRMIPLFRSLISLPAGVERMAMWQFVSLTTLGSLIWNSVFVVAGYLLGANWQVVAEYAGILQNVVIGLVIVAIAVFVVVRLRERKRSGASR
ncbi:DedA family protein [Actinophytocola oryzae]|uniref:Membrane protein DedA with SNARE-associated domain n=1 Tax=Actinophytocola oryzae TaxID=502181 RepID=A0A4R7VVG4_9PSEU|nr:DedA family protein [Actinophytocola oryzae]TDV54006.1 membrane protein DedA with SNARE-associated domain [Actinophytocola oryzae]